VVQVAGILAARRVHLDHALRDAVVAAISDSKPLGPETRAVLESCQQKADDQYLDVLDSLGANEPLPSEAMESFVRARALAAVLAALSEPNPADATEVVYEVLASGRDDEVLAAIESVLKL
jgi:hypothetical protein